MDDAIKNKQFHIVTGKGGVGKSHIATALALAFAKQNKKVLLTEFNTHDRLSKLLGVEPTNGTMYEPIENLHLVDIHPKAAMKEYALLKLKFKSIYKLVFENPVIRLFLDLIPSLSELLMLGKIAYHADQQQNGKPLFDHIILDAPATGHAISTFQTPRLVLSALQQGPLADAVNVSYELLNDHNRTAIHVICTPEELPVNESLELLTSLQNHNLPIGWLLLNQCTPSAPLNVDTYVNEQLPQHKTILETMINNYNYVQKQKQRLSQKRSINQCLPIISKYEQEAVKELVPYIMSLLNGNN